MAKKSVASLAKKLDRYAELTEQHDLLKGMLEKAVTGKASVPSDIFERVTGEYQKKFDETETELEPLHSEIESLQKKWSNDLTEAETKAEELKQKMQEAEFRHLVGEYDDPKFADLEKPLRTELAVLATTADEIREKLDQIDVAMTNRVDSSGHTEPDATPPAPESTDSADALAEPAEVNDEPELVESTDEPAEDIDVDDEAELVESTDEPADEVDTDTPEETRQVFDEDLIDLTDWTKEFQRDGKKQGGATLDRSKSAKTSTDDVATKTEDVDLATAMADDSETSKPTQVGFPVLIIVKGPGEGKKLPLLPMTMTLGREHDNNLELKDEDVARYHARIVYRSGDYVIEDLESSAGTWVNGKRISETPLGHGDKIRVGSTEMVIDFD